MCIGCNKKRSVIIDQTQHLERHELETNGLANYIDIHEDLSDNNNTEHGVKLFVDSHFHVRSHNLLGSGKSKTKGGFGLPSPSISLEKIKLEYLSASWNSMELSSRQHNVGFIVIHPEPTIDNEIVKMSSELGTVVAKVNFRKTELDNQQFENSKRWINILVDWIETSPSLNAKILPSIIRYIDERNNQSPNVVDQLAIPILLDYSSKIRLIDDKKILEDILGTTIKNPFHKGMFYPSQSVDYESFFLIRDSLSTKKFVRIKDILNQLIENSSILEQTLDTFVLFFFELVENNSIEYMVSYLL